MSQWGMDTGLPVEEGRQGFDADVPLAAHARQRLVRRTRAHAMTAADTLEREQNVTERKIRRAIRSARKEGLNIAGVTAAGVVLVYSGDERPAELSIAPNHEQAKRGTSWDDV